MPEPTPATKESFRTELERLVRNFQTHEAEYASPVIPKPPPVLNSQLRFSPRKHYHQDAGASTLRFVFPVIVSCFFLVSCPENRTSNSVTGTITDKSGAVIRTAEIVLTDQRTGLVRQTHSNNLGFFSFDNVPPGPHALRISKAGFRTLQVTINKPTSLGRLTLEAASVGERVTVELGKESQLLQLGVVESITVIESVQPLQLLTATFPLHTPAHIRRIEAQHGKWLSSGGKVGAFADLRGYDLSRINLTKIRLRRALLSGVDLVGTDLREADLSQADLSEADLSQANLKEADLRRADAIAASLVEANLTQAKLAEADFTIGILRKAKLVKADLVRADLTEARLPEADLTGANLTEAKLPGADLSGADLTAAKLAKADLRGANLIGANITSADLSGARLDGSDLRFAIFEPDRTPDVRGIAAAIGLELLTYKSYPDAFTRLRDEFKAGGFQEQERKITYALKRTAASSLRQRCPILTPNSDNRHLAESLASCAEYALNRVFFDFTCQYGMSPLRPLVLLIGLWLVFSLIYAASIHSSGISGLYVVKKRLWKGRENAQGIRIRPSPIATSQPSWRQPLRILRREAYVFRAALYFSFITIFSIGIRGLDFPRGIRLLTAVEYDFKPRGWVRPVSGIQSLISVGLVALALLAYFGRPFE